MGVSCRAGRLPPVRALARAHATLRPALGKPRRSRRAGLRQQKKDGRLDVLEQIVTYAGLSLAVFVALLLVLAIVVAADEDRT